MPQTPNSTTREDLLNALRSCVENEPSLSWRNAWARITGYLCGDPDRPDDPELYAALRAVRAKCVAHDETTDPTNLTRSPA